MFYRDLSETVSPHVKSYENFSRVFEIANQVLTRQSDVRCLYNRQNNTWLCRYGINYFSCCVQLDAPLVRCAHLWSVEWNTRREILYLRIILSLCICNTYIHILYYITSSLTSSLSSCKVRFWSLKLYNECTWDANKNTWVRTKTKTTTMIGLVCACP